MALIQHTNIDTRFTQQVNNAREYLIPFVETSMKIGPETKVMEIGCGEGGVLKPFIDRGAICMGVDLSQSRIDSAKKYLEADCMSGKVSFLAQNVYESSFQESYQNSFDLIILKDSIEHIPEQEKFIPYLKQFLTAQGRIFFGFPPWYMPFGGHQQICKSKVLGFLPYYHLLPTPLYKGVLKIFGESEGTIKELLDIKATGISIERFEKIVRKNEYKVDQKRFFLFNPIYKFKFGLTPRKQFSLINKLPFLRNFLTTAAWYMIRKQN